MVGTLIRRPLPPVSDFIRTLLDDATATAALATLGIVSGTYTPTLFNTTNIDASTAYVTRYIRVGNIVIVSGRFDADTTAAAGTSSTLGISLPVASNLTVVNGECNGVVTMYGVPSAAGVIFGDIAGDRAAAFWNSNATVNQGAGFSFMYTVQ